MANHMLAHRMLNRDFEEDPTLLPNPPSTGVIEYQEASPPKDPAMLSKFSKILKSFKAQISPDDTDRFKVTTFSDLKSVVIDIQAEQARRKSLRNMTKIRPYLDGLSQYAAVIEVFVNSKPDILAFIWGPIKFCLKIASNFSEAFDALLDAYKQIGDALPIFSDINDLFSSHSNVQQILVNVYEDILDFHGRAVKFFKQRAWKITVKLAFRTFGSMFRDVLENLERSRDLLYQSADIASFREAQDSRTLFKQQFDAQKRLEMNDKRSTALEWLSHESCEKSHEELQETRKRFPNTTRWVFNEKALKGWFGGQDRDQPFWISGMPGAGKTVLFSSIVDEIRTTAPSATVIFFYCKYNNVLRNSYQEIAKSLIAQLLYNNDDCLRYLYEMAVTSRERHPSTTSVLGELLGTMARLHRDLCIGIDGIDECEPLERRMVLSLVHDLLKLSDTDLDLKIFLASCAEKDIEDSLRLSTRLALEPDHLDKDIQSYVEIRSIELGKNFSLSEERVHEVAVKVADRPKGMFLLARLIMDNLHNQETWEDIDEELRSEILPRKIDEAYGRILLRIRKHDNVRQQARVKQILGMITVANRSMWLHEIQGALSLRLDDKSIDFENRRLRKHLKEICGPMVEVHEDGSVELIHHTAKTFLVQLPSGQFINANTANRDMVSLCMTYLTFDCVVQDFDPIIYLERVKKGEYAFLEYSVCYWLRHMRFVRFAEEGASKETMSLENLCRELLKLHYEATIPNPMSMDIRVSTPASRNVTLELLDQVQESFDAIHTLANDGGHSKMPMPRLYHLLFHIRGLVEDASERTTDSLKTTETYGRLIFKCPIVRCKHFHRGFHSRKQRDGHLKSHERPYKCTIEGCDYQIYGFGSKAALTAHTSSYHEPPREEYTFPEVQPRSIWKALEDAIDEDDEIAVRALCEEAARLPDKRNGFLLRAIKNKSLKAAYIIVELLGGDKREMDYKGRGGRRALMIAAESGEEELVRNICGTSADVNTQDTRGRSPICMAAAEGHQGIVKLLLQHPRLDISLGKATAKKPLFFAAVGGHLEVVRTLLEIKGEWFVEQGHFLKALRAAGETNREAIVRFMLEKGATFNVQITYDKRLAAAMDKGIDVAADLLLGRHTTTKLRGQVDGYGNTYGNALYDAALQGDETRIKDLLEQGADINNISGEHGSALQAAAFKGRSTVVEFLLRHGADVNASGGRYESALQVAAYGGRINTVQLLLENGADVNASGGECGSVLQAAASQGHMDTLQLLLKNGADVNASGEKWGSALQAAAKQGQWDPVQLLLKNGADVNASDEKWGSALQAAAFQGYMKTVQLLLKNGADVNASGGAFGSALQAAANQGQWDTVQLLLKNGADVNVSGGYYGSALQGAAHRAHNGTVQLLLKNGADVNASGGEYGSALEAAKSSNSVNKAAVVETLEAAIRKSGREMSRSPSTSVPDTSSTPLDPGQIRSPSPSENSSTSRESYDSPTGTVELATL